MCKGPTDEERIMSNVRLLVALAAISTGTALTAQTGEPPAEVVIRGIGVVDVEAGQLLTAHDIVVRGTTIASLRPTGRALPRAKTLIDGRGKVAVPGLIAARVRLAAFSPGAMQGLLAQGVTAVQDAGTDPARLGRWREDLTSGRLYAPRITAPCAVSPEPLRDAVPTAAPDALDAVHREMARLVSGGRRPIEALRAVTLDRARALCLDGLGAIAQGAPADLVVLEANPLEDITRTRAIDAVVFRGEVLTRAHVNMLARGTLPLPTSEANHQWSGREPRRATTDGSV
jgi:adenine deaminase